VLDNSNEGDEDEDKDEMEEEERLYAVTRQTFDKAFDHRIEMMHDFLNAFEHQQQFRDPHFLSQFEQTRLHSSAMLNSVRSSSNTPIRPVARTQGLGRVMATLCFTAPGHAQETGELAQTCI
jgi:hypothetical protein